MAEARNIIDFETRRGFRLADRYVLTRALRTIGVGQTYLADDIEAAKQVLVVVHSAPWAKDAEHVERFEARARALQALEHANLASLLDFGVADLRCFAVLERVDGERLADRLARKRRMSLEELVPVVSQLLKALEYAHARDTTMRCLDPSHIWLCSDGVRTNIVRVVGAGIGELMHDASALDERAMVTDPDFASPEQLRGDPADARSDVFAMGRLMIAMLQGDRPQSSTTAEGRSFDVPLGPSVVPDALLDLIESCIAPRREDRPSDGAALVERLIDAVPNASMFRLPRVAGGAPPLFERGSGSSSKMARAPLVRGDADTTPSSSSRPIAEDSSESLTPPKRRRSILGPLTALLLLGGASFGVLHATGSVRIPEALLAGLGVSAPAAEPTPEPARARPARREKVDEPTPRLSEASNEQEAAAPPEARTGLVTIESQPPGTLFVDGREHGTTPFRGELEAGSHAIEIEGPDGTRWAAQLEVDAGKTSSLVLNAPTLEPGEAENENTVSPTRSSKRRSRTKRRSNEAPSESPDRNSQADPSDQPHSKARPTAVEAPEPPAEDPFLKPSKRNLEKQPADLLPSNTQE